MRRRDAEAGRLELQAVVAVLDPVALALDELTGIDGRQVADDGDLPAAAGRLDAQHRVTVLRIVERHPLDDAGEWFGHGVIRPAPTAPAAA